MLLKKIIIDTDIGDDIDDAFALALLSRMEGVEVVGVTTVFRNTLDRAQQAIHLLKALGKEIPVYAGERLPIKEHVHPFSFEKGDNLENAHTCQWGKECENYPVREGAVDFIIECAQKYGKDLVIMPIGPLTNIARAIQKAPQIMKKVGQIVQMGGWFTNYLPEWNIVCDPEAANVVWSFGLPVYAVGLDVTLQCSFDEGMLQEFKTSSLIHNKIIMGWFERWFNSFRFEKSVMHDPLAIASYFDEVCTFKKKYVKVNLTDKRGAVECYDSPFDRSYPIYTAVSVDKEKFYSIVKRTLL